LIKKLNDYENKLYGINTNISNEKENKKNEENKKDTENKKDIEKIMKTNEIPVDMSPFIEKQSYSYSLENKNTEYTITQEIINDIKNNIRELSDPKNKKKLSEENNYYTVYCIYNNDGKEKKIITKKSTLYAIRIELLKKFQKKNSHFDEFDEIENLKFKNLGYIKHFIHYNNPIVINSIKKIFKTGNEEKNKEKNNQETKKTDSKSSNQRKKDKVSLEPENNKIIDDIIDGKLDISNNNEKLPNVKIDIFGNNDNIINDVKDKKTSDKNDIIKILKNNDNIDDLYDKLVKKKK
jgi:hypothetical protein